VQTLAHRLFEQGAITREELSRSAFANVLVSSLGAGQCEPQAEVIDVEPGDVYLLCSDGLIEGLDESRLPELLRDAPLETIAPALIAASKAAMKKRQEEAEGGSQRMPQSDNMTVVLARFQAPPEV
jgi:serine/threonine protein phosphatase PrpC